MTLYKLIKMANADILRLHYPTHGEIENYELSIAMHHLAWNEPETLTFDVTIIDQFIEMDNMVIEVWTTYGEHTQMNMLEKLGDNTKPTIEQALQIKIPSVDFADDITLADINDVSDMVGCSIIDVLNHIYTQKFAVELFDTTEHEMDYRGFTAKERETVEAWLNEAGATAHWVDGRAVGFEDATRRYIVDFEEGSTDAFTSIKDMVESAEYCLAVWHGEEEEYFKSREEK